MQPKELFPRCIKDMPRSTLVLGELQIDIGRMRVLGRAEEGRLTPKPLAVLIELARFPGETVTRDELLDRVWGDAQPTPDALSHAVRELRRALGDDARAPTMVETIHGLGYRLMLPVSFAIDETASDPDEALALPEPVEAPEPAATSRSPDAEEAVREPPRPEPGAIRKGVFGLGAIALAALIAVAALGMHWNRDPAPDPAPTVVQPQSWQQLLLTSDPGAEEYPKFSPDGSMIVYTKWHDGSARYGLRVRSVVGTRPVLLTQDPDADALWPVWSPDGLWIAYVSNSDTRCSIKVIPATGGASRQVSVCDGSLISSLDWSLDGTHLLMALPSDSPTQELRIHRVPLDTGEAEALDYEAVQSAQDRDPVYSGDGSQIAFRRGVPPEYDVFVVPAQGGPVRRLTHLGSVGEGITWTSDGKDILFWSDHEGAPALFLVNPDTQRLQATGIVEAKRPHVSRRNSRLAFQRPLDRVGISALDPGDAESAPVQISPSSGTVRLLATAPSRSRLAYVSEHAGDEQLWLRQPGGETDLAYPTGTEGRVMSIDWSDDETHLLLVFRRNDRDRVVRLHLDSGQFEDLGLSRDLLRDAMGSSSPDRVFAIVPEGERPMLARFDRGAQGWQETRSAMVAAELFRVSGRPGVFGRIPPTPNRVFHATEDLQFSIFDLEPRVLAWFADESAVWYVSAAARGKSSLRRLELASGEDVLVRPVPNLLPRRRVGMGMLANSVTLPLMLQNASDILVLEYR